MNRIHPGIATLFLAMSCLCTSRISAEEAPATGDAAAEPVPKTFAVLKITRGHEIIYEAVAIPEKKARMNEIRQDAKEEVEAWEAARAAFLGDKANKGEPFLDRKPEEARVSTDKEFETQEEAKAWAVEKQRKTDGDFAIIEVTDTSGKTELRIVFQKKINALREDLKKDYEKESAAYKKGRTAWYNDFVGHTHPCGHPEHNFREWFPYTAHLPEKPELKLRKGDLETKEEAESLLAEMRKTEFKK